MMTVDNERRVTTLDELQTGFMTSDMLHGTNDRRRKRILILGGGGFLGTVLTGQLLDMGHSVTVLDSCLYGSDTLTHLMDDPGLTTHIGDVRDEAILERLMTGKDAVVNLAAIVGDEACRIDPDVTWETNVEATALAARVARRTGVRRIVHASTCSTYGKNGEGLLRETAPLAPLSLYADSKIESERVLHSVTGGGVEPSCCILRLSTLFGFSRRPRFDLVVNTLTAHAWKNNKITIFGGDQWRPLLHVSDAARAFVIALESEADTVAGKIYNTGGQEHNTTILDIGMTLREILPGIEMDIRTDVPDRRDYRVDFSLIREELRFEPRYSISNGIYELIHALESGRLMDPEYSAYSNYRWLSTNQNLLQRAEVPV